MRLFVIAALALAVVAGAYAAPEAVPRQLVGTWAISNSTLTIKSNGHGVLHAGTEVIPETVTGTRTTVTFKDVYCPKGTYTWKVAGKKLTLSAVHDTCVIRRNSLNGTWTRK